MKTLVMLVVAGGLYAADATAVGRFGKTSVLTKPQSKCRAVTNVYKPTNSTLQFNN
jgi:hypothetical protein